jgi:hypothetical protein
MSDKNPFDDPSFGQSNTPSTNAFDDPDYGKSPGIARSVGDTATALAGGAVTGAQLLTNLAGADNAVSKKLGETAKTIRGFESAGRRAEREARAEKIKAAEESGSTWEEVKANLGAFAEAPVDTTVEALGTSVPTIAAAALTRGRGANVAGATVGAGQGAGAVKGSIYDAVEQEHLKAGATPEEAAARAAEAQAYSSDNAGQIALGAGLGAVAGSTGVEGAVSRMVGREAGEQAAKGVVRSTLTGAAKEAPLEAAQGGQERLAANLALQGEGFDTPTWQGVAGSAALEGVAGGAAGGAFGAVEGAMSRQPGAQPPAADPLAQPPLDQSGPGGAAPTVDVPAVDPTPAPAGFRPQQVPDAYRIERLTPSQRMGLDPEAGPISAAAVVAVDSGTTDQLQQQAAIAEAAAIAEKQGGKKQKQEQPAAQAELPMNIDPETGEILDASPAPADRAAELQSRLDFVQQQARNTGWSVQLIAERDAVRSELEALQSGTQAATQPAAEAAAEEAPTSVADKLLSKRLPDMTDDELRQAAEHYGPEHKRTKKIAKELRKRSQVQEEGSNAASTTEQAQPSPVPQSPSPSVEAAPQPQPVSAAPSTEVEAASSWDSMTPAARKAVADQTDIAPVLRKNLVNAPWERIGPAVREKLTARMQQPLTYEKAKADADAARARSAAAGEAMNKFPRLPNGLTPDEVKATPEWKAAKAEVDASLIAEQNANSVVVKNFPKENRASIQAERERKATPAAPAPEAVTDQQLAAAQEESAKGMRELGERAAKHEQEVSAQRYEANIRELAASFPGTYSGRSMGPLAADIADHAIKQNRRLSDSEIEALSKKHDIPVDVVEQIVGQPFSYDGIKGDAERGLAGAVALRARHMQKAATEPKKPAPVEGRDLGDGWAEFSRESGTKGVPRADMPQIKAEHRGAMVNFMNARGIAHQEETVSPDSLKPTQAEFSRDKVAKAKAFDGGNRAILVSKDGHVLDGHHQWMAARDSGEDVRVIRLDAPIDELLNAAHEFPSSTTDASSASGDTQAEESETTHRGARIYPINVRIGGELVSRWAAQSRDNIGTDKTQGDSLHQTRDQAVKQAEQDYAREQSKEEADKNQAEREAADSARKVARQADNANGFIGDGVAPNVAELTRKALDKLVRIDGAERSIREHIDGWSAEGTLSASSYEEWKIKDMSRQAFNRATQAEQDAHARKQRQGGKKTVYLVNDFDLGKIAHDYAQYLLSAKTDQSADASAVAQSATQEETPAKGPLPIPEKAFADLLAEVGQEEGGIPVFVEPAKTVRSEDMAKANGELLTPEQAQQRIAEWEAHAKAQGKSGVNNGRVVLSLFDTSGEWSQPWQDAGYEVHRFDIQDGMDVNDFSVEYLTETLGIERADVILAAPPCTDFSRSGAHAWKAKDADGRTEASVELVRQTLRTIEFFRPSVDALENPVGRIAKLTGLPKPTLNFQPNSYGDPYTKRTMLWGSFNPELPLANVEPTEGTKMTTKLSGRDKYQRSLTPKGFAYSFFMANNLADMAPAQRLAAEFKGIPQAEFQAALDAGVSEADARSAVQDSYYDQDLEAARADLTAVIPAPEPEPSPEPTPEPPKSGGPLSIGKIKAGDQFQSVKYGNTAPTGGTIEKVNPTTILFGGSYMGNPITGVKLPRAALVGGKIVRDGVAYDVVAADAKPQKAPRGILAKKAEADAQSRADYFTPGNVVPSYGGNFDRVISYQAPDKDGHWSVTVRAVEKRGDSWVDKPGERERNHMTLPDARELKKGPVFVAPSPEAAKAEAEAQEIVISYGGSSMPLKLSKPAYQTTTAEVRERAKQNGLGASMANSYADKHVTLLRQALSADLNVPADVLADYPGLIRPDLNDDQSDQMVDDLRNLSGAEFVSAARVWGKAKPATLPAVDAKDAADAFPLKEAAASYSGISHRGTDRAKSDKAEFEAYIDGARSSAMAVAHTQAQRDAVDQAIKDLRTDYLAQYRRLMNVRAGTVSSYVAGGSNFNSKQAGKRNSAYDRAIEAFTAWQAANTHKARKAALDARTDAEKASDADAAAQANIEKAQKERDADLTLMRKILSWKKGGEPVAIGKSAVLDGVNKGRDGYPTSIKIKPTDGSTLTDDKFDLAALFRDRKRGESVPDSKRRVRELVDAVRAEDATASAQEDAQAAEPAKPSDSKTPLLDAHVAAMDQARDGKIAPEAFRAAFAQVEANGEAMRAEMNSMSKDKLLRAGGVYFYHRHKGDRKAEVVEALYRATLDEYSLGKSYGPNSYMLSGNGLANHRAAKAQALRDLVANTDEAALQQFAAEIAESRKEREARKEATRQALENPKTLPEFRSFISYHSEKHSETRREAYLRLTPEQRRRYDELEAEGTREAREQAKNKQRTKIASAGNTTAGEVIATKHTKHGHDLYVVKLEERVSREDYDTLNSSAKRMGGSYSSYRGNGAIPGFQFRTREAAEAFRKLVAGDTSDAQEVAQARRDAFEDDRSQSAVERLRTMAAALNERAEEELGRDRKVNTARRARMASAAEGAANANKALAGTMENIADAIEAGKAKFLDLVRQKVQVEFLGTELRNAKDAQIRAKYQSYADQVKHRGQPIDDETVDYSTFPTYGGMRSDLAGIARQMIEVDGLKNLGQRLLKVADDVSDAYVEWAKNNLLSVSRFARGEQFAEFTSRDDAERAIRRSNLSDRAIVLPLKRGVNRIVLSPSEAMKQGIWQGDDKRIALSGDFGREIVEAVGRRAGSKIKLPWQLETVHAKRKRLEGMGIYTGSEYRAALREFAALQQAMATPDKIKQMERAMIGRRSDGLDFFPTSEAVVDAMLEAAEIAEGMGVLEPSAGMGHIADAIREKTGVEPDVVELSGERRELLQAKGYHLAGDDFMAMQPRTFYTFGDIFQAPDGTKGIMHGGAAWSGRASLHAINEDGSEGKMLGRYARDDLTGIEQRGSWSGYDRIVMNPPFSKGRDIQHVQHAYSLLKPGGRLVAIMGEGAFFQSNSAAEGFRAWLDDLGATSERLPENSFMDAALPVNTAVNARMVVIDKPATDTSGITADSARRAAVRARVAANNYSREDENFLQGMLKALYEKTGNSVLEHKLSTWLDSRYQRLEAVDQLYAEHDKAFSKTDIRRSFAGRNAQGADLMALATAKERIAAGWGAESVRKDTGWSRGADGKWRFEISDDQARLAANGDTAQAVLNNARLSAFEDGRSEAVASDVLDHPQLFAAYPELASVPITVTPVGVTAQARLRYVKGKPTIMVKGTMPAARLPSSLLHELQHAIQRKEGYATGGSKESLMSDLDPTGVNTYRRLAGEVEARNTQMRQRMTPAMRREIAPQESADTAADQVIITFNGKDMIDLAAPKNASRPALSEKALVRAFNLQFPKLSPAVSKMLARGKKGEKGGVVILSDADPLAIAGAFSRKTGRPLSESVQMFGDAGKVNGFYDPRSGLTFLVGPNLDPVTGPAVLLHEMTHGQQKQKIDQRAADMLMNRGKVKNADLRTFLDRVANRMIDAGETANAQEAAAYIVEQAVIEGRSQGYALADSRFLGWVDSTIGKQVGDFLRSVLANIRQFMLRNGMPVGEVTVDDLVQYAMVGVEQAANGNVNGGELAFSRDSQINSPAFKSWFGDSKVVDAEGKPLVVYHGTGADFAAFDPARLGAATGARTTRLGFYFTDRPRVANTFALASGEGANVLPVYLSIENPFEIGPDSVQERLELGNTDPFHTTLRKILASISKKKSWDEVTDSDVDAWKARLERAGYDGIWIKKTLMDGVYVSSDDTFHDFYIAFRPEQIKSAIGNTGTFDPSNPDIRFSRSAVRDMASKATAELNKTFSAPGKLSLWHKTVGTMYNLAQRSEHFRPVYESAQGFVDDVAYYSVDAAEMAPRLLPQLETWSDILKTSISADDNKAVARPVFEGTLMWARDAEGKPARVESLAERAMGLTADQKAEILVAQDKVAPGMVKAWRALGEERFAKMIDSRYETAMLKAGIVWSDAELRSIFNLTDDQISLYREFRAATDRSLDTMGRADMLRYGGKDVKELRDQVMDAKDIRQAASILTKHLVELAAQNPDSAQQYMQAAHGMNDRANRVLELQREGYAPLSRFGKYTVDVVDASGERQYFSLFETKREANTMAEQMREAFPGATINQGTLSEEAYKMFAGITPESLELFGNMLGLNSDGDRAQDQAFQEYLRLTKTNRSAMRRLIHRKGIAGYSEDVGRVLASFVYSNSRQTAAGLHMGDLSEAVNEIPQAQGELKDAAVRLAEYIKNPQEEGQAVRGLLFAQYLGGSVASAFVNMTQPVQVTFPWLSQFGGAKQAAAELAKAAKQMSTKGFKYEAGLAEALHRAELDGVVSPQEVHQLMAQARGTGSLRAGDGTKLGDLRAKASNNLTRLSVAWGKLFSAAEQINRRMTYIASYRIAQKQGMPDPDAFARKAVRETQFVYSKASKMRWGRGAIGGTLMTFKTYIIAYLELMHRLWNQGEPGSLERAEGRKAVALMIGMLFLVGGADGLPFMEDAEDVVDGAAQLMGYNFSSKKVREQFLEDTFGRAAADFIERGVSGLPGAPLDVSGRLGMGNLIPGTGLLQERTSHTRDVLEIAGPMGDFASRVLSGGRKVLGGDIGAGLLEMSPGAVRNAVKGADMAATGMYRDAKGYKVLDTNILEAAMKSIGFQPASVAEVQGANYINQRSKAFYSQRAQEIRSQWAAGIFEKDQAKVDKARQAVQDWNARNPDQPMVIRMPDVLRRVREMSLSKHERIAKTAPRAMRQQLREELSRYNDDE